MTNSKNIVAVVIIIVAVALLVGVFLFFGRSNSAVSSGLTKVAPTGGDKVSNLSHELLAALSSLKDLKLNVDFFKDKAFASLTDQSGDIKDEALGRTNPFLPIQ